MDLSRRDLLALGGLAVAGSALPSSTHAQQPKKGGTLALRLWDPPHFDHMLIISYKTNILLSFTHSRLIKQKAGPAIAPGTFPLEATSQSRGRSPNENTFVFKLRRGVKWHNKPPVNGREFTADDVVYSIERFRTVKGNSNAYMLKSLDKVEAVDKYTVKFTLKEPFAWFLDMLASPMAIAIVAKEAVEKFGDLKKAESVIGTGPWMLDSYRPNVGATLVRNPGYFIPGLPHIERIEVTVDEDNASRMAAFMSGKYDLGWEFPGIINRTDWVQIKTGSSPRAELKTPSFRQRHEPHSMRTDQKPFSDERVRQASHAIVARTSSMPSWRRGCLNRGAQALKSGRSPSTSWERAPSISSTTRRSEEDSLRRVPKASPPISAHDVRLTVLVTRCSWSENLKDVGIDAKLDQKEYGAYIATCFNGNFRR